MISCYALDTYYHYPPFLVTWDFLFIIICTISISLSCNCSVYFFPMQKKVNVMKLLMQDPQTSLCITLYSLHIAQCQVYFHWYNIHQFSNLTSVDTMIWKTFMKEHVLHTWIWSYKHEYRTYISWYGYGWYASLIIFYSLLLVYLHHIGHKYSML